MAAKEARALPAGGGDVGATTASATSCATALAVGMQRLHREQLTLCAALEDIADALPDRVDCGSCSSVAERLLPLLHESHRFEEERVFPAYQAATGDRRAVERLRGEHLSDECFADELTEVLRAIGHGGAIANAEALGFMLRGFFEALRRHIAFERDHVVPTLAARPSEAAGLSPEG